MQTHNSLEDIARFLGHKRLALVGVSRDPRDFTRGVMREFERRGYEVVPVNPATAEIEGKPCFANVQDIEPPVRAALLFTPPGLTEQVVRQCADAGISSVWMHRGGGRGAVSAEAVAFCRQHRMTVVAGECPYMFLPGNSFFHRVHGWVRQISGSFPRAA